METKHMFNATKNSWIWVVFPDPISGEALLKRRRLATEIAEYGTSRLAFDDKRMAEAHFYDAPYMELLRAQWKAQAALSRVTSENHLAIVCDVLHGLERGKTIRIT